jgi:hypothetical protein
MTAVQHTGCGVKAHWMGSNRTLVGELQHTGLGVIAALEHTGWGVITAVQHTGWKVTANWMGCDSTLGVE